MAETTAAGAPAPEEVVRPQAGTPCSAPFSKELPGHSESIPLKREVGWVVTHCGAAGTA